MTHEQNVPCCLNLDILIAHLNTSNFHRRVLRRNSTAVRTCGTFSMYLTVWWKRYDRQESHSRETKILTETVKFTNLVLVSDPLTIVPILSQPEPLRIFINKVHAEHADSFLSLAWSGPRRDVVPVWLKRQQTIMLIIVLCNAFCVGVRFPASSSQPHIRTVTSLMYAEPFSFVVWTTKKVYSFCYTNSEIQTNDDLTITYLK